MEQSFVKNIHRSISFSSLIIMLTLTQTISKQLLNDIPVVFKIDGNVSYVPTSGVTEIPGYIVKIGYDKNSWIGVKFMDLTSSSNYDILVVQRGTNPVGGLYETTVADYFVSEGRQTKLISDSVNNMDKHVTTYSQGNYFFVQIYRTKGITKGEDWEGGEFVEICFLTSPEQFNINQWSDLNESCYGYSVSDDYYSTYRGKNIMNMTIDKESSMVYGGIEGPPLTLNLFWYCPKPVLSSDDVILRISDQIDPEIVGYDYHKCGSGDYFGFNTSVLTPDKTWSGYDDGSCTIEHSAASSQISYTRPVFTYDDFDSSIYNETEICVTVGSNNQCEILELQNLYPIMSVTSSFTIFQNLITLSWKIIVLSTGILLWLR